MNRRKNSRHFKIILAPFRKDLCAKTKNFWRDLPSVFGTIFSTLSAHIIEKDVPQRSRLHSELIRILSRQI
ncbi:hypothetical protein, partial [Porphyromonas loveana]